MKVLIDISDEDVKQLKEFLNFNLDCEIKNDTDAIKELFLIEDRHNDELDLRDSISIEKV